MLSRLSFLRKINRVFITDRSLIGRRIKSNEEKLLFLEDLYDWWCLDDHESFYLIFIDEQEKVVKTFMLNREKGNSVTLSKYKLTGVIENHPSKYLIVTHNHPSGIIFPSEDDKVLTKNIEKICAINNVVLLDHLIFARESFYSIGYKEKYYRFNNAKDFFLTNQL